MARQPRLAVGGVPHLVSQHGHNRQPVFRDMQDRERFLDLLREASSAHRVALHAYALLDSRVLLLATPDDASDLSQMMKAVGRHHVFAFNRRHGHVGTLWQGRFHASPIDALCFGLDAMCFIDTAPQRAGKAHGTDPAPWTSAAHHLGLRTDPLISDLPAYWRLGNTPFEREAAYQAVLERGLPEPRLQQLTAATQRSWALGSGAFLAELAQRTPRRLAPAQPGRPPKVRRSATD